MARVGASSPPPSTGQRSTTDGVFTAAEAEAFLAANQLSITSGKLGKALEQLSSGQRINRSADDAAGLAISEKMRSLIRGLQQGSRNGQEASR